jgi:hypothetical protein
VLAGVPGNASYQCASQVPAAPAVTATDDCDGLVTVNFSETQSGDVCAGLTITRTWSAADTCGNAVTASQTITVVDTTPPPLATTATQVQSGSPVDVKDCAQVTLQGTVTITVLAEDACGAVGVPTVSLSNGTTGEQAVAAGTNPDGSFNFTWAVTEDTLAGTWTVAVTAADACGNATTVNFLLCVGRTITGTVHFETLATATYSVTRSVVLVATDGSGDVKGTWSVPVDFHNTNGVATGTFALAGVPPEVQSLSAKTAWHLRSKTALTFDLEGRAVASFNLRGGDLDGSNQVQIGDYDVLLFHWYTLDDVADINGDGQVQLLDYAIMKYYWFENGDPQ